ncbi:MULTISPECIES: DUF4222 domain-containing protein [Symbiopectobacterium]|uniref:DUF4222 domain-containing protein n=1 Tax=Symbiopectobacterium TaxID=801 RepID=UPI001A29FA3D|nr:MULTISPECIES: DUF4222 domain-containing protein [Symbiopectobacterium]MBG6248368.1 DUF4222 domain-containing protein [Candidatus Symbiopectobacterium sp. PLON1]MBT9430279.1 DUF4222 domain-containing protein [Candidatus Symbiopectobacterium endolongispinus]
MDEQATELDRRYLDPYGRVVHVIGYDRQNERVIFMREGYEHECVQPPVAFQSKV